jgi:hypothetical protein
MEGISKRLGNWGLGGTYQLITAAIKAQAGIKVRIWRTRKAVWADPAPSMMC